MKEVIKSGKGKIIAIILREKLNPKKVMFFTPAEFSQQLGLLRHKKGAFIRPHIHKILCRNVAITQEVLHIKKGKIKVDLYDETKKYIGSRILKSGDTIMLAGGGHGIKIVEESLILEIKQGPYAGSENKDKEYIVGDRQ